MSSTVIDLSGNRMSTKKVLFYFILHLMNSLTIQVVMYLWMSPISLLYGGNAPELVQIYLKK